MAAEADRITARASYLTSFALHDEFQVEWTADSGVVPPDDFGLALDDPASSSKESGPYAYDDAGMDDTGALVNPEAIAEEPTVAQPITRVG